MICINKLFKFFFYQFQWCLLKKNSLYQTGKSINKICHMIITYIYTLKLKTKVEKILFIFLLLNNICKILKLNFFFAF